MVIVGAGLSGLVSALHLLDMEVTSAASITVLDGRKRVGGRLLAHQGGSVNDGVCVQLIKLCRLLSFHVLILHPRRTHSFVDLCLLRTTIPAGTTVLSLTIPNYLFGQERRFC